MKRREFLKASLATGSALSLLPGRVLGANDDIRIGVVGMISGTFGRFRASVSWPFATATGTISIMK